MSGWDDESCDIMRHHATSCDRERKRVGSGWRKTSFVRRRCGRETRWWERKRKAGASRKRKRKTSGRRKRRGFPLQLLHQSIWIQTVARIGHPFAGLETPTRHWAGRQNMLIEGQQHPCRKILTSKLSVLEENTWTKELDTYPDLVGAIRDSLYNDTKHILIVDTSQCNDFHADVSVAKYDDTRLPYSIRYFLEFKLPSVKARTAAHCGQMLDYFKSIREKQPHRSRFIGILSNYSSSWVYNAMFDEKGPKIEGYPCSSLADAIIFAETSSASQLQATIPSLDKALDPKFSVLLLGKHYFLLSVKKVFPLVDDTVPKTHKTVKNTPRWFPLVRHWEQKNQFVLKITHDNRSLENEITTLQKLRNAQAQSLHIPELVWICGSGELGILQIGEPVLPGLESAAVSRKVVRGMIDGLRYLHSQGIIHRDVRLSNLIPSKNRLLVFLGISVRI